MIQSAETLSVNNLWGHEKLYESLKNIFREKLWTEEYEKIKYQLRDQLLKVHVAYRLVKTQELKNKWRNYKKLDFEERIENSIQILTQEQFHWKTIRGSINNFIVNLFQVSWLEYGEKTSSVLSEIFSSEVAEWNVWEWEKWEHLDRIWNKWILSISDIEKHFKDLIQDIIIHTSTIAVSTNDIEKDVLFELAKLAWALSEWKHHGQMRDIWWEYIHHPIAVTRNNLEKSNTYNIKQSIVDLLHDVVEDTNISFETIQALFWSDIAIAIEIISKKSSLSFISKDNNKDIEKLFHLLDNEIINSKYYLNDYYKSIIRKIEADINDWSNENEEIVKLNSKESLELYKNSFITHGISENIFQCLCTYFELYKNPKYSKARNQLNKERLENYEEAVKNITEEKQIKFSEQETKEIEMLAATCKTSDRYHNNSTPKNIEQHFKNIDWTEEMILPWAKKVLWKNHPNIERLEEQVRNAHAEAVFA